MSITVSTDVFCDACPKWVHGCTGGRPDSQAARRQAKAKGWVRRKVGGKSLDLCPKCASTDNVPAPE